MTFPEKAKAFNNAVEQWLNDCEKHRKEFESCVSILQRLKPDHPQYELAEVELYASSEILKFKLNNPPKYK